MKIRTRIFLLFTILTLSGFYALVDWLKSDLRQRYLESLEEPLVDTANILATMMAAEIEQQQATFSDWHDIFRSVYQRDLRIKIYKLDRRQVDMRVYATDEQGIVIFDSDAGRHEGHDYSKWNDVYLTLRGEYGARSSEEDLQFPNRSIVYVAAPILIDGEIKGVLSVGKPTRNVDRFLADAKHQIAIAGWVAVFGMLLVAFILYYWVSRPIEQLTRYVESIKQGKRARLPDLGNNEIGVMGSAMEEMRAALDGKDYIEKYVQTLTHEIKSPLAAIRGAAELLQEDMPEADRQRFLDNLRKEVTRAQALIDRMLQLATLENRMALHTQETFILGVVAQQAIDDAQSLAETKSISINSDIREACSLLGDPFLVRQAINNLLTNAISFADSGSTVELKVYIDGDSAVLELLDRGAGIPDYAMNKLFERFYSLQRPDTGEKSTGLGLSLVKEIALLHGGQIELSNRPEGGVCARLSLPLHKL